MLARASAAEVWTSAHQDSGRIVGRLVEDKVWVCSGRVWVVSSGMDEGDTETGSLDSFEELFRDDGVCVDVAVFDGRRDTLELGELGHAAVRADGFGVARHVALGVFGVVEQAVEVFVAF